MITFTVYGLAAPKGSGKAIRSKSTGKALWLPASKKTQPWEDCIVREARVILEGREPCDEPMEVSVTFYLPRPKTAPKRVTEPAKLPDVDKLLRTVLDGLKRAGLYRDDSQVVFAVARKAFAGGVHDPQGSSGIPRAEVRVREAQPVSRGVCGHHVEAKR